jgi:hypothetical protein
LHIDCILIYQHFFDPAEDLLSAVVPLQAIPVDPATGCGTMGDDMKPEICNRIVTAVLHRHGKAGLREADFRFSRPETNRQGNGKTANKSSAAKRT